MTCVEFIININDIIIYCDVSIHMAVLLIRQQYALDGLIYFDVDLSIHMAVLLILKTRVYVLDAFNL